MQSVTGRCHGTLCSVILDAHGPLPWLTLQVAVWAGSCCGQALLLADNVLWTRAATASLQQLASGNNHALQALGDSAALQLETIAGALRQCKSNLAAASSVIVQHEEHEDQPPGSSRGVCHEASSCQQMQVPCVFNTEKGPSGSPGTERAACTMNTAALSRVQLCGLQILIGNAVSHREVAAELRAAGVTGPTDFEWGKQLRFYWDPEPSQLQVKVVWLVCRLQCLLTCLSAVAGSTLLTKSTSAGSHMVRLHRPVCDLHLELPCDCRCALAPVSCHTAGSTPRLACSPSLPHPTVPCSLQQRLPCKALLSLVWIAAVLPARGTAAPAVRPRQRLCQQLLVCAFRCTRQWMLQPAGLGALQLTFTAAP